MNFSKVLRFLLVSFINLGLIYCTKSKPDNIFCVFYLFTGNVFRTDVTVPWEYNATFPLRSIPVMYIITSLPLSFLHLFSKFFGSEVLTPYLVLVLPRLTICLLSFISDFCLYRVCYLYGQNFRRRLLVFASSYVTLTYSTRTFSNTVEMILFNILLYLVAACMAESEKVGESVGGVLKNYKGGIGTYLYT